MHAAAVALYRRVDVLLHTGKGNDLVELGCDFGARHAENSAIEENILSAG